MYCETTVHDLMTCHQSGRLLWLISRRLCYLQLRLILGYDLIDYLSVHYMMSKNNLC